MSTLFENLEKFDRSNFPDLEAAEAAVSLETLITPGRPAAKIAADEQDKQEKQLGTDFCSFGLSLKTSTERGGENACADKHQYEKIDDQLGAWQARNAPNELTRQPTRPYTATPKLPKPVAIAPGAPKARSLSQTKINYGATSQKPGVYYVPTIKPAIDKDRQNRQAENFIKAQAGQRGVAVGDAAVVLGANGQPYPGSSYLDRADRYNQSANLASSTPPVIEAPTAIKSKSIGDTKKPGAEAGQIAPQSNTAGNIMALLGIAGVITAIMFALQYVISTVTFIFNMQSLLTTCNNIAASFSALFNTIGSLLGLGEDISKPLDDVMSGLLNSAFGKEKVDYVKYQWSKVSSALSAAANVIGNLRGVSSALGNAVETGTNNTGRIGNALRAMGFFDRSVGAFEEKVSAKQSSSKLTNVNNSLQTASTVSQSLTQVVSDVKSGRDEQEALDKEFEAKQNESTKDKTEADKRDKPADVSVPNFKPGDY
jgi:hypothetical protein